MTDEQLFAGWEIWQGGKSAVNWDSFECKTWEKGIDFLKQWMEEGGNK